MSNLAHILLERNREWPTSTAYFDDTSSISYGELDYRVRQYAQWFITNGLKPDQRVCVYLHDCIDSVAVFLGIIYAGGIAIPGNPRGRQDNIKYQLSLADPKFVIAEPVLLDNYLTISLDQIKLTTALDAPVENNGVAFMLWTSGTTGFSKAVMHTHQGAIAGAITTQEAYKTSPRERLYCTSKFYFCFGLAHDLIQSMWAGATALLDSKLATPGRVKANIKRFQPDLFFTVPVIYSQLITRSQIGQLDCACISSGDRLPEPLIQAWEAETGQLIMNQLGNTEMLIPLALNWDGTSALGKPVDGYSFKVVDEDGNTLGANQVGRLLIQGPSRSLGYYRDIEWTEKTYQDWLITNDSVWMDQDGVYHNMGRVSDVIKVSGQFVNPTIVEETIQRHPDVEQAAVVSREYENGVHRVEAYIVLKPGASPKRINLRRWVLQEHERHTCPRVFHFVDELPRTDSGKVQRYKLRQNS